MQRNYNDLTASQDDDDSFELGLPQAKPKRRGRLSYASSSSSNSFRFAEQSDILNNSSHSSEDESDILNRPKINVSNETSETTREENINDDVDMAPQHTVGNQDISLLRITNFKRASISCKEESEEKSEAVIPVKNPLLPPTVTNIRLARSMESTKEDVISQVKRQRATAASADKQLIKPKNSLRNKTYSENLSANENSERQNTNTTPDLTPTPMTKSTQDPELNKLKAQLINQIRQYVLSRCNISKKSISLNFFSNVFRNQKLTLAKVAACGELMKTIVKETNIDKLTEAVNAFKTNDRLLEKKYGKTHGFFTKSHSVQLATRMAGTIHLKKQGQRI